RPPERPPPDEHAPQPQQPEQPEQPEPQPEPHPEPAPSLGESEGPLLFPVPLKPESQPSVHETSAAQFDEMIKVEIRSMFASKRSRAEVERFLERFQLGQNYVGMLDELEASSTNNREPGRRGLS